MMHRPMAGVLLATTGALAFFAAVARARAVKIQDQARALENAAPPATPPAPASSRPQLPSSTNAPQLPESIPSHPVQLSDEPPATSSAKPTVRTAKQAAQALYDYATRLIRGGQAAQLGSKGAPNATIKAAQVDMRGVQPDGIYGPKTMARGKELLGREFPARTSKTVPAHAPARAPTAPATQVLHAPPGAPPVPATRVVIDEAVITSPSPAAAGRAPQRAAQDLLDYVAPLLRSGKGGLLGSKGKPNLTVQSAQQDMGQLVADGIYGAATRKRGLELIGKSFPARV